MFNYILIALVLLLWMLLCVRLIINSFSKVRKVEATVINKHCFEKRTFSKMDVPKTSLKYVITFDCGNKKLHFYVSEFSYGNYTVGEKGTLQYKGTKLIDFK